ncbi:ornithine--oxo-acid transaminase [bacterium]|nr:MAG: ornithine--oxo-acid transaminase [bacterium]
MVKTSRDPAALIALEERHGARNYAPLNVVITEAQGVWATDVEGRPFLDCISGYSALSHGHAHPRIVAALVAQAQRLALTSRAVRNDRLGPFLERLTQVTHQEAALPMNTGAEAVETAIKLARRWGYVRKGIPRDAAEIVVFDGNFHGRTTTIVGFSSTERYRRGFGPFDGGFRRVPFDDIAALQAAAGERTCAVLLEPIQGEGGVNVPRSGYLRTVRELCTERNVLFMADEIQTGFGRTGDLFACDHEGVIPDVLIVGKALGGGVYPVSAALAPWRIMELFEPGDHGSTFGGNPLACAVGEAALDVLLEEHLAERARHYGSLLLKRLREIRSPLVRHVRGRGLLIGVELTIPVHNVSEHLLDEGVLAKETRDNVLRLAPPLIVDDEHIDFIVHALTRALKREEEHANVSLRV